MSKKILALDIGGSKILTALVGISTDNNGKLSVEVSGKAKRCLSADSGKNEVWAEILDAINETFKLTDETWDCVDRIGVTIPGIADPMRGYWIYAPFSGIRDFPISEKLQQNFSRPAFADNDVNACAWGEKVFGVCQNVDNFLWLTISNGIGGGLVLGGKIFSGAFSGAAEVGHFNIVENGELCGCGNRGCLEATAAGPAIARSYRELVRSVVSENSYSINDEQLYEEWTAYLKKVRNSVNELNATSAIHSVEQVTAADIAEEAYKGNPIALKVYKNVGRYVGHALSYVANLINPEKIVIGGGVSGAFDLFYPSLWESFQTRLFKQVNKSITIEKTGLGYEAGLLGAAAIAFNNPYCK